MSMVQVRVMRMLVTQRGVMVHMGMRFGNRPVVQMLMMFVMNVAVLMVHRVVFMGMNVALGQVHYQPEPHERRGNQEL
jgi:hypothetical protein